MSVCFSVRFVFLHTLTLPVTFGLGKVQFIFGMQVDLLEHFQMTLELTTV